MVDGQGRMIYLPSWRSKVSDTVRIGEHLLGVFKSFASGFGKQEESMNHHAEVKDAEYDVDFVSDRLEGGRDECTESSVEGPIRRCRQSDGLSSYAQWV